MIASYLLITLSLRLLSIISSSNACILPSSSVSEYRWCAIKFADRASECPSLNSTPYSLVPSNGLSWAVPIGLPSASLSCFVTLLLIWGSASMLAPRSINISLCRYLSSNVSGVNSEMTTINTFVYDRWWCIQVVKSLERTDNDVNTKRDTNCTWSNIVS